MIGGGSGKKIQQQVGQAKKAQQSVGRGKKKLNANSLPAPPQIINGPSLKGIPSTWL